MLAARTIDTHKIYTILKHGGADEPLAEALVEAMKEATDSSVAHLATREDLAVTKFELKEDIVAVRSELAAVKSELKEDIAAVRSELIAVKSELKEDIAALRSELKEDIHVLDTKIEKYAAKIDSLAKIGYGIGFVLVIDIIITLLHL